MENNAQKNISKRSSVSTWLFNPFHFIAGGKALVIGLVVILVSGVLVYNGYHRFDGVVDFHANGPRREAFWYIVADGYIAWLIMSVLLTVAARIVSTSRVRIVDIFGTQALARWPMLIAALIVQPSAAREMMGLIYLKIQGGSFSVVEILLSMGLNLLLLVPIIWMVALMYMAFAVSCNARGAKAIITFVVAVLVGELLSKVAWFFLTPLAR